MEIIIALFFPFKSLIVNHPVASVQLLSLSNMNNNLAIMSLKTVRTFPPVFSNIWYNSSCTRRCSMKTLWRRPFYGKCRNMVIFYFGNSLDTCACGSTLAPNYHNPLHRVLKDILNQNVKRTSTLFKNSKMIIISMLDIQNPVIAFITESSQKKQIWIFL